MGACKEDIVVSLTVIPGTYFHKPHRPVVPQCISMLVYWLAICSPFIPHFMICVKIWSDYMKIKNFMSSISKSFLEQFF